MTPDEMIEAAIAVADEGMAAGELPIGAVVLMNGEIVGRAFTQERAQRRRVVHADLLAIVAADEALGLRRRPHPLSLAVNLEPCLMCLGAAMALGVSEIYFGLESPGDGAAAVAANWAPSLVMPTSYATPVMTGGLRREQVLSQFRRYCQTAPESGYRRWAQTLADLPE
jgi:tRNA(adenine34) deaminase